MGKGLYVSFNDGCNKGLDEGFNGFEDNFMMVAMGDCLW